MDFGGGGLPVVVLWRDEVEEEGRKPEPEGTLGLEGELRVELGAADIRDLVGEVEGARPKEGAGRVWLVWAVGWNAVG